MNDREKLAELPSKLTAEMACILEDCGPSENQKDSALAALIEMYQPMWDRLIAVASVRSAPQRGDAAASLQKTQTTPQRESREESPSDLRPTHPDTIDLIEKLSWALGQKLRRAEIKYGYTNGWLKDDWEHECRQQLLDHLEKGDPLDVVAYASFIWARGWTAAPYEHEFLPTFEIWADAMLIGQPDREILRQDIRKVAALPPSPEDRTEGREVPQPYEAPFVVQHSGVQDARGRYVAELSNPYGTITRDAMVRFIVDAMNAALSPPERDAVVEDGK